MKAPGFWRRDRGGIEALALTPISWAYGAIARARYAIGKQAPAGAAVICIGNLVAGGAGKTPVALAIGEKLIERRRAVHFLTRGYGGTASRRKSAPVRVDLGRHTAIEVGDEALLLARLAPTWVGPDRAAGARAAVAAGAEVIVMDDGYQNPGLKKDFSLLVVDGDYGFGNERLLPAGPLREPLESGLGRACAVAVIGGGGRTRDDIIERIQKAGKAVILGRLAPEQKAAAALGGRKVVAFAGIGRPEKFFETLVRLRCDLVAARGFADHHPFADGEIEALKSLATRKSAELLTTEKDYQRLSPAQRSGISVLRVSVAWENAPDLERILAEVLSKYVAEAMTDGGRNG